MANDVRVSELIFEAIGLRINLALLSSHRYSSARRSDVSVVFFLFVLEILIVSGSACRSLAADETVLANPSSMLQTAQRHDFVGRNSFERVIGPNAPCLRSTPQGSASGLYQATNAPAAHLTSVQWQWTVDRLSLEADIRTIEKEDFAAKIAFVFGEPTLFSRDVPTLAYVWTATPVANGAIVHSARFAGLRYIQLRGAKDIQRWWQEKRDVISDFRRAFGAEPPRLHYIAIFNDNDQTRGSTSAIFCAINSQAPKK